MILLFLINTFTLPVVTMHIVSADMCRGICSKARQYINFKCWIHCYTVQHVPSPPNTPPQETASSTTSSLNLPESKDEAPLSNENLAVTTDQIKATDTPIVRWRKALRRVRDMQRNNPDALNNTQSEQVEEEPVQILGGQISPPTSQQNGTELWQEIDRYQSRSRSSTLVERENTHGRSYISSNGRTSPSYASMGPQHKINRTAKQGSKRHRTGSVGYENMFIRDSIHNQRPRPHSGEIRATVGNRGKERPPVHQVGAVKCYKIFQIGDMWLLVIQ